MKLIESAITGEASRPVRGHARLLLSKDREDLFDLFVVDDVAQADRFGVGDRDADWMLIGEAPGENEDKQGEPFVGQAGKLLDSMLHAVALSREDNVFIANVIKCRPPGNRNPELDEVARCEPYLKRQVELVKPKLIVALGRFAAQSLLKTEASIASLRGRVHDYQGVPVIVTYHPAYLLRSLPDKAKAWADLCLAQATYRKSPKATDGQ